MSERKRVEREEKRFQRGNLVENKLQSGNRNEERFQKTCSEKTKFQRGITQEKSFRETVESKRKVSEEKKNHNGKDASERQ